MGIFFGGEERPAVPGIKKFGFARYKQVLENHFKELAIVGFITLIFFIPFAAGEVYAILSQSLLVALLAGLVGGAIAGPGYACMMDLLLRRMRGDLDDWWTCWKRALRQNFRAALLPGMVQCTFMGAIAFASALILWGAAPISPGTLLVLALSCLLTIMLLSVWWPQVVLFEQSHLLRLKNALLFCILHIGRMLGTSLLQFAWWAATVLLMPWSAFVVPFLSVWYILLLSVNLFYTPLDHDFRIEEQINQQFPGRLTYE